MRPEDCTSITQLGLALPQSYKSTNLYINGSKRALDGSNEVSKLKNLVQTPHYKPVTN